MGTETVDSQQYGTRPRVLIVEDEWLIAEDFGDVLVRAGFDVVGPASTAEEAHELIDREPFVAALLDVNLTDGNTFNLADRLTEKGVPYAYITGYNAADLPDHTKGHILVNKPVSDGDLPKIVTRLISQRASEIAAAS